MKIGEYEVENSECEELLGAKLDWKLNCDDHISNRCKKDCGELNALVGIAPFIGLPKRGKHLFWCSPYLDVPQPHK